MVTEAPVMLVLRLTGQHVPLDTTKSMGDEVKNLKLKIKEPNTGIIDQIRQRVTDTAFGVSRFDDFPTRPTPNTQYDYLQGNSVEDGYGK